MTKRPRIITTRVYWLRVGLTRKSALVEARRCDRRRDFRAFTYNPKTGKATLT